MARSCQDEQATPMAGTGSVLPKGDLPMDPWSHRYMPCYHGLATRPGSHGPAWACLVPSFGSNPRGGSVRFPFLSCWGKIRVLEGTWKRSTGPSGSCVAWRALVHEVVFCGLSDTGRIRLPRDLLMHCPDRLRCTLVFSRSCLSRGGKMLTIAVELRR
ncbi:hypothetical protein BT67DRAFT_445192 [Trichocladium antarcticum]|uniref:Uncharacterized protein n=1 Tax=Trichocladium antarcticum TaxID=1450529 RepID=A0AAN6UDV8_9PEZI|nr:hypothetical protein BT67DRAFT_445192 [Trichocladium antarcticum]